MSPGVQKACTPGVERAKWMPRSSSSSLACGSYHESAQRAEVASLSGDRVGQRAAVGPRPPRRRLDHHHAHVALGAEGEELFGRLAVLGPGPQRGIDREHHRVEVETAQCLEMRPRHLHVVPGDPGEAGVAGVTQGQDPFQRRRAPVELLERGHGMGLVEVQHLGVEQAAGRVELVRDAVGVGPQRLARDEQLLAVRRQVRTDDRLGRAVLRRDVEVVHPVVEGQLQPLPRLVDGGGPAGGAAQHGHAALVTGPSEASALHGPLPLSLELQDVEDGADVVGEDGEPPRLDVGRPHEHAGAELLRLRHRGVGVGHREVDAPDRWHLRRHVG